MKLIQTPSSLAAGTGKFDLLRVRLEAEIARPAVIALTSSTSEDGSEVAAQGLANSLAGAGYSTLYIETSLAGRSQSKPAAELELGELARLQAVPNPASGVAAVLTLSDATLQRKTSQRGLQTALETLRSKFDYVVINAGYGASASFATSIVSAADAVLVAVKKGRREGADDTRLSSVLELIGARFLGVVSLDLWIVKSEKVSSVSAPKPEARRSQAAPVEKDRQRRDVAESRT